MARPTAHKVDLVMILKAAGLVVTLIIAVGSCYGAYYSIIGRLDRTDERITQQGDAIKSMAESIKSLAEQALSPGDLRAFCLEAALANRGWTCPLSNDVPIKPVRPARRAVQLNKATAP